EDGLEKVYDVLIANVEPAVLDQPLREQPVVIEAAFVLVLLDGFVGDLLPGEVGNRALYGRAVGLGHVHQDPVHVKDDQILRHIASSSVTTRSAWARVPTVIRTHPGAS